MEMLKKRRTAIYLAIPGGLLALWVILRITGMLNIYSVPTTSLEPRFKVGNIIWASNLVTPVKGKYVVYHPNVNRLQGPSSHPGDVYLGRLMATGGDIVEIRGGILYINGKLAEDTTLLQFGWIDKNATQEETQNAYRKQQFIMYTDSGYAVAFMPLAKGRTSLLPKWEYQKGQSEPNVWLGEENHWNRDWFGPFEIPKGHVFILNPNRSNAFDSRYQGPIAEDNLVATSLNQ